MTIISQEKNSGKSKNVFGVIGGSGLYNFFVDPVKKIPVKTPFGDVDLLKGNIKKNEVYFLNRHGTTHSIPPHLINHKANLYSLWNVGVTHIISTSAVGSLTPDYAPGDFVILEQFVDFVSQPITFFDGTFQLPPPQSKGGVIHTDFTNPYCSSLQSAIISRGKTLNITVKKGGVYVLMLGPRFETPAEIRIMTKNNWGNLVGMTNPPEAILARELTMHYASIALVTNFAAGLEPNKRKITQNEVLNMFTKNHSHLVQLIYDTIVHYPE